MTTALKALLAVCLAFATAEVAVRLLDPAPRVQIVRGGSVPSPGHTELWLVGGEPVWSLTGSEEREHPSCGPEAAEVLLIGSSIFWGTGYEADEVVSHALQQRLDPTAQRWCVRNHAQPGFTGNQKVAIGRAQLAARDPAVVVWEVWANDVGDYELLGEDAFELGKLRRDADGYPVLVPGLGFAAPLMHALFRRSHFYQYLALTLTPADEEAYERTWHWLAEEALPGIEAATRAGGGSLLLVYAPFLDRPFAQSVEEHRTRTRGYQWVDAWARSAGVATIDLADAWRDLDPVDLRHDPCCHYNPAGHQALADVIAQRILSRATETP